MTQLSLAEVQNLIRVIITITATMVTISISVFTFFVPRFQKEYEDFSKKLKENKRINDIGELHQAHDELTKIDRRVKWLRVLIFSLPALVGAQITGYFFLSGNNIQGSSNILQIFLAFYVIIAEVIVFALLRGGKLWS